MVGEPRQGHPQGAPLHSAPLLPLQVRSPLLITGFDRQISSGTTASLDRFGSVQVSRVIYRKPVSDEVHSVASFWANSRLYMLGR